MSNNIFFLFAGSAVKDSPRLPLPQRDSGSEEGGSSPAGSPRPERGSQSGLIKSTHRALLGSSSLLASIGLGRCLDIPPRVPPRTSPSSLGDRTHSEPEISTPKTLVADPPVVDDLITFSTSQPSLTPLLDLPLQYQELKPLPLTPPPPNPREKSSHRTPHALHSPQSPKVPLRHGRASPVEWTPSSPSTNGELGCEAWVYRTERRRRSSQGLNESQLGLPFSLFSKVNVTYKTGECRMSQTHCTIFIDVKQRKKTDSDKQKIMYESGKGGKIGL